MAKRRTHEEYVAELAIKNPNIEVIEEYINNSTPIEHHCLKHNVYWNAMPHNILNGAGCKECQKEKSREKRLKTNEQYIKEVAIKNPTIEVVGEYAGSKVAIMHHCLNHDVYWNAMPCNILQGKGCNECLRDKIGNKLVKSQEQYVKELSIKNKFIEVADEYINSSTPIVHRCLLHNTYWKIAPLNALRGEMCPECKKEKLQQSFSKTHEQYVNEVALINPDICVVGKYINAKTPIVHKCKIDGVEWLAAPSDILSGRGCPQCKESSGERQVRLWLERNKISYIKEKSFEDCRDKQPLPFDFYIPELNVAIEHQGQQHYFSVDIFGGEHAFELQKKHDNIKYHYCKNNDIKLLCIPYYANVEEELNNFLFI